MKEEIRKIIKEEIEELRQEMNLKFDRVDERLDRTEEMLKIIEEMKTDIKKEIKSTVNRIEETQKVIIKSY